MIMDKVAGILAGIVVALIVAMLIVVSGSNAKSDKIAALNAELKLCTSAVAAIDDKVKEQKQVKESVKKEVKKAVELAADKKAAVKAVIETAGDDVTFNQCETAMGAVDAYINSYDLRDSGFMRQ